MIVAVEEAGETLRRAEEVERIACRAGRSLGTALALRRKHAETGIGADMVTWLMSVQAIWPLRLKRFCPQK
jgi:hypothetical protein